MKERIHKSKQTPGLTLLSMQTGAKRVVSVRASLLAGERFAGTVRSAASLVAQMFRQGAGGKSKDEIANLLESSAIELDISSGASRVAISASLPVQKAQLFVDMLAELLREPSFPKVELTSLKARYVASIKEEKQNTQSQAWKELCRSFFTREHPMYEMNEEREIGEVEKLSVSDLSRFHTTNYGLGALNVSVAGDVDSKLWAKLFNDKFGDWHKGRASLKPDVSVIVPEQNKKIVNIKDKANCDIFWGHPVVVDITSREFFALKVALHILGGDFVSRLMQEVREKRGLTYGVSARLSGVNEGDSGLFNIWATFAPTLLDKGIKATEEVVNHFADKGITSIELARAKQAMPGNYLVSLATSGGVSSTLLSILETGRDLSFIDEYPKIIESLTLAEVNTAIKKFIRPNKLVTVAAGSI